MNNDFQVLITAEQAWPAFERAVLGAEREISCGFRIFDFGTKLRSEEGRAIGETWADLLEHVVRRGVQIRIVLSDFDPVMATPLHELTWRSMRQAIAIQEILGPDLAPRFVVIPSLHPARAGLLPWLSFLPGTLRKMHERIAQLNTSRLERQAVRLDPNDWPQLNTVSHHQKIAVIDRSVVYLGGLDLNERRFDTPDHDRPADTTWSDIQLLIQGPEAEEAAQHLDTFLDEIAGKKAPREGAQVRRTLSAPRQIRFWALSPRTVLNEIEQDHVVAFNQARHLIYIETQFFRSRALARELADVAVQNTYLSVILVLPALPEDVAFEGNDGLDARYGMALQAECLEMVMSAFDDRICVASPVQPRMATRDGSDVLAGSPVIHVHNKVLITDDDFALVGSANLNGRSMRWDTEVAVRISQRPRVTKLWAAVTDHWWQGAISDHGRNPRSACAWWRDEVARNSLRSPHNRSGFLVRHDTSQRAELRQDLPGVTDNIV